MIRGINFWTVVLVCFASFCSNSSPAVSPDDTRNAEYLRRAQSMAASGLTVPAWLLAGLAGNLDKGMLARHRSLLAVPGVESGITPISDVLGWVSLPEGWHGPQAVCGLATAWLLTFPSAMDRILDRLEDRQRVTPEWLAVNGVGVSTVPALESRWRVWRERQARIIQDFGQLSTGMIRELKALVNRKADPGEQIQKIRALTLGQAPELAEVGELYCYYYEGLIRGAWALTLNRRLARAEAALAKLETVTRARQAYVDSFLREGEARPSRVDTGLEKSAMESYVDEAEKKFDKR